MFITHGERIRKYAPWILAGVLLLLLPGFVLLFSPTGSIKEARAGLPTIGGKPVNQAEFQQAKNIILARELMSTGHQPTRSLEFEDELNIQAIQDVLLLRKAREFGIHVTDEDVVRQIRVQPYFLNQQRQFDPERFQRYTIYLNNLGLSESQFEEIIRQEITLMRLRALVAAPVNVTPLELKLNYTPLHEQTTINYVAFDAADYNQPINVTDDEAKAYYEQNKEAFRKPAEVKVRYVYFTLSDARKSITVTDDDVAEYYAHNKDKHLDADKNPKPLAEVKDQVKKELIDLRAERLAGDRATGFSVKLVYEPGTARPDFAKLAAEAGVTPKETGFFNLHDSVPGVEAGPDFNQAAFSLNPEYPFSDPVRGEDGYYVMEYLDSKPSEVPPFDEAKQQVIERVKRQRAYEAVVKQGREMQDKVKQAAAHGKSFAAACSELHLKVKTSPPFTAIEESPDVPAARTIQEVVLGMPTNSLSDFIPTAEGGLFFHLQDRHPPSPEELAKDKPQFEARLLERDRQALFNDWVNMLIRQERVEYKRKAPPARQQAPTEEGQPAEQSAPSPSQPGTSDQ
ncbi:MAG TPA: peptidyl-prolyl cis-trans isomerase [Verrucomicrobiae bacterium]|nr:peptidyl-prolyl cis-trans isomerase [Verrucomicrobiae bacterium]